MLGWALDHWWLTTATPYVLFNIWLAVEVAPSDAYELDDIVLTAIVVVFGCWIILGLIGIATLDEMGDVVDRRVRAGWHNRTVVIGTIKRIGGLFARWLIVLVTLLALYVVLIANVGWRPGRLEILAELWSIAVGSYFIAQRRWGK